MTADVKLTLKLLQAEQSRAKAAELKAQRLQDKIDQFIHGEDHPDQYVTKEKAGALRGALKDLVEAIDGYYISPHDDVPEHFAQELQRAKEVIYG